MHLDEKKELVLATKKLSVLYAEDELDVRESTARLLCNFFADVYTASNGAEALEIYREKQESISVVITDILMPFLDGIALAKEIFKLNKHQKVIVISAHNESRYFIDLLNSGGISGFLQKPLKREDLFDVLQRVCRDMQSLHEESVIELKDGYRWDFLKERLYFCDEEIFLTANEQTLLQLFLKYPGQLFSAIDIHTYIYDDQKEFSADSVKSLLKRLRKKLPQDTIHTKKGIGYFFKVIH